MISSTKSTQSLGVASKLNFGPSFQLLYYKNPIILNKQYNQDIIPGVYQGGFQLWQCEIELLKKMFQQQELQSMFAGKKVCEIGCGHGLLAIGASFLNAESIVLQDYNANVIQELTKPTVAINAVKCPVSYLSGDWSQLKVMEQQQKYDIIIGSQLVYRQQNYSKLISFIKNNLKSDGKCILANKSYYFGVGGSVAGFREQVQEKGLVCRSLFKIVPKLGGNKKEIIQITFNHK